MVKKVPLVFVVGSRRSIPTFEPLVAHAWANFSFSEKAQREVSRLCLQEHCLNEQAE